jgi:transcriptional regulator with XRE-family HTH domain
MSVTTTRLRRERASQELTKRALAARAGVSYDTVQRAERGDSISDVSAMKLARALKVDPGLLFPDLQEAS